MDYYKYKECIFALSDEIVSVQRATSSLLISKDKKEGKEFARTITIKYRCGEEVVIERLNRGMSKLIYNHIYDYLMGIKSILDIIDEFRSWYNKRV